MKTMRANPSPHCRHADRAGLCAGLFRIGRASLQRTDHFPAGQPERDRSGADHLRHGLRQLLRRFPVQAGGRRGPDLHQGNGQRLPGEDSVPQQSAGSGRAFLQLRLPDLLCHHRHHRSQLDDLPHPCGSESPGRGRESRHGGCGGHQRAPLQVPFHLASAACWPVWAACTSSWSTPAALG